MIIYNGVDLEELIPLKIEDIVVSPIQLNPVARQRAIGSGAEFVRTVGGDRKVTITFALLEMNREQRETDMQKLRTWAKPLSGKEYELKLPQFEGRHLVCACTMLPDHSYRKWFENKLRIELTCFNNPFWTSDELMQANCGASFSVGGDAPPLMTIERSGNALNNQTYATDKAAMTFSKIPSGSLVIDLNRQTAAVGGTSIMGNYVPTSTWIKPKAGGNQKITGNGVVKWRERWV